tara:strand:+ start:1514 stop:2131 length:618 start_codon:yes stop_codon:yes gene_type:complete
MSTDPIHRLRTIIDSSETIEADALNRDDPRFQPWHEKARQAVVENAPIKICTFDEITFASDFFLTKPIDQREDINDRIALVSDFRMAVGLLRNVTEICEKERSRKKRKTLHEKTIDGETQGKPKEFVSGWEDTLTKIKQADFSFREKEEVLEVLEDLHSILQSPESGWDRFKRGVKFLLDFDRDLALELVPFLLERFEIQTQKPQ